VDPSRVKHLVHGQRFDFKHLSVEVLHMPGHTPGLVCLYSEPNKLLFADDHVLARVSPNPLLDLTAGEGVDKFRALSAYMKSAMIVHGMELDCVLPGHGEGFKNHKPLLEGLFGFYLRRQEKLLAKIAEAPATVSDLVKVVFPRVEPGRLYLMISEVLGNLEVLEDQGKIRRIEDVDVFRFAIAA
jgi:glyoxylase-like metal-dependent hydrolase (beta-lactamase superfamily II)